MRLQKILDRVTLSRRIKSEKELFADELGATTMKYLHTLYHDKERDSYEFGSESEMRVRIKFGGTPRQEYTLEFKNVNLSRNNISNDVRHILDTMNIA